MDIPEWGSLIIKVPEKLQYLNKEVATLSAVHNQPRTRRGVKGIRLVGVKDWRPNDAIQEVRAENLPPRLKKAKEWIDRPKRAVGRPPKPGIEKKQKEPKQKTGRPAQLPKEYYYLTPAMRALYNKYRGVPFDDIPTNDFAEKRKGKYQKKLFNSRWNEELTDNPQMKVRSIGVYMKLLSDYPQVRAEFTKIGSGQYYTLVDKKQLKDEIYWVCNYEVLKDYKEGSTRSYVESRGRVRENKTVDIAEENTTLLRKLGFNYLPFRKEVLAQEEEAPDTPLAVSEEDEDNAEIVYNKHFRVWYDNSYVKLQETAMAYPAEELPGLEPKESPYFFTEEEWMEMIDGVGSVGFLTDLNTKNPKLDGKLKR